jgi:hypothetical protein
MGKGQQQQPQAQPTSSTVTQTNIPEYAAPYFTDLLQRAQATSQQPYTPYTGQRIADIAPQTTQAISDISQNVGTAQPYIQGAGTALGGVAGNLANVSGYQAPTIQSTYQAGSYTPTSAIMQPAQMWNQQVAQQYMSPYQQSVTDIAKQEAARQSGIQGLAEQAQATQAGGYGGYRQGLVESERQRNLGMLQNQIQQQGSQAAYNQAAQQFSADRAAQLQYAQAAQNASQFGYGATQQAQQAQGAQDLQAQQAQAAANQAAAQLQLGAGQAGLGLAQGLGSLGTTAQKSGAFDVSQLLTAGDITQQAQQASLNQAYQDFLAQQYYPMQQEQFLSSILRGTVVQPSTLQATYQPPYDPVAQALALGIGGAGLAKAFG